MLLVHVADVVAELLDIFEVMPIVERVINEQVNRVWKGGTWSFGCLVGKWSACED